MNFIYLFHFQVKIQLGEGSAATVTKKMLANEGIGSFYKVCSFRCCPLSLIMENVNVE